MTGRSVYRRRRAAWSAVAITLVATATGGVIGPGSGVGQPGGPVTVQPDIAVPASAVKPFGSTADGGEVWGFGTAALAPALIDGQPLERDPTSPTVILRHTDSDGWRVAQAPLDENGQRLAKFSAAGRAGAGRVTPNGGGALLGRASSAPVVLARNPGERFLKLPDPDGSVLAAGETMVTGDRYAMAAVDEGSKTGLFVGPQATPGGGVSVVDGVLHFDGDQWQREPIDVPAGTQDSFEILALAASATSKAWMLAQPSASSQRGIMLLKRELIAGQPHWLEQSLGASPLADRDPASAEVSLVQANEPPGEPLTATSDGVWIDGTLRVSGEDRSFTAFFDGGSEQITGSWCDLTGFCSYGFGARFSSEGYRSFAWAGPDFGTRVITKPLKPGGEDATNRGAYLTLEGSDFERVPGIGGGDWRAGAFSSIDEGWLGGANSLAHITRDAGPNQLQRWPVAQRRPLTAVAGEPGREPGAFDAGAVAVGANGGIARYVPGQGWSPEFLLNSAGQRAIPRLRGVAWPEPGRAYAVGDLGEMWVWQSNTGLWERDEARPLELQANLMDVEFQPGSDSRGYAIGRKGTLMSYGKTWTQDPLPVGIGTSYDLLQIAFAGGQALVSAKGPGGKSALLVHDGSGWRVDGQAQALIDSTAGGSVLSVGGLPDGGAVAAGYNFAIKRESAGSPWQFTNQPIGGRIAVAAAAIRPAGKLRAVLSVVDQDKPYPSFPPGIETPFPGQPPPPPPPPGLPQDGFVLRESEHGWVDEQHAAFEATGQPKDAAVRSDAVLALLLGSAGSGWAVGGETGEEAAIKVDDTARRRIQTSGIFRYPSAGVPPQGASSQWPALSGNVTRLAIGGHAVCEQPCADFANLGLGPDRGFDLALRRAAELHRLPAGPRVFAYTGGRLAPSPGPFDDAEAQRFATLAGSAAAEMPFYAAVSPGESGTVGIAAYKSAFASSSAPFGGGSGARTHYAFDTQGSGGRVRVIVIDNSAGSLAASDPHQNPPEAQEPWLRSMLADARSNEIPAVVVGSRDLNTASSPGINLATDADQIAKLLVEEGASAYFFDRPEENRVARIPAFAATTIPSFGTGTLGYRNLIQAAGGANFDESGFLLTEVNVSARDPQTNRAPVGVRLIPVIEDLAIEAVDSTLLRRSRPALFTGLGRRAVAGQREPSIAQQVEDPYISLPPDPCVGSSACAQRIEPEFEFLSSNPDIGDFVRRDPSSSNLRDVLLGPNDKPIADSRSGLFCAYNAGKTTVTVRSGGLAYAQQVTVQAGSVRRPCGTVPLTNPPVTPAGSPSPAAPPPPAPGPAPSSAPPVPAPPAIVAPKPPAKASTPFDSPVLLPTDALPPLIPPVPAYVVPRPPPPGTLAGARFEEEKEEEPAYEDLMSASRYQPQGEQQFPGPFAILVLVLAAFAAATIVKPRRRVVPSPVRDDSR